MQTDLNAFQVNEKLLFYLWAVVNVAVVDMRETSCLVSHLPLMGFVSMYFLLDDTMFMDFQLIVFIFLADGNFELVCF